MTRDLRVRADHPSRRGFLAAVTTLGASAAGTLLPGVASTAAPDRLRTKRLLLLTLYGGNDGLNTLVPYRDPLYRALRPTIALPREKLLPLNDELALHPELRRLARLFEAGELAVVPDVGYPRPDLSHFESIAVWESGEERGTAAKTGWWAKVLAANRSAFEAVPLDAAAISFEPTAAFARGYRVPILHANQNLDDLFTPAGLTAGAGGVAAAARPLAEVLEDAAAVRARIAQRMRAVPRPHWGPSEEPINVQVRLADWFLAHGTAVPMVRMALGGFDHHTSLLPRHHERMVMLDRALGELSDRLRASGLWNDSVIVVHSEFGRRPGENGFAGTDHGTSGPVLILGGRVGGGVHGRPAALDRLDDAGNLLYQTDLRSVYASAVSRLFALPVDPFTAAGFQPLPLTLG